MVKIYLRRHEYNVLVEALRRRMRFAAESPASYKSLLTQWVGLGTASAYKQAMRDGFMEIATSVNPGYATWFRLTAKGALVVAYWIGQGWTYERIEKGELPDANIPAEVL
jgi:hypothetical protein